MLCLCIFLKLWKKLFIRNHIFLGKHNILYSNKFGLCTNHSTDMAVLQFVNNTTQTINDGNYSAVIFLDLSKASDTVDHNLFHKLSHCGTRGMHSIGLKLIYQMENNMLHLTVSSPI